MTVPPFGHDLHAGSPPRVVVDPWGRSRLQAPRVSAAATATAPPAVHPLSPPPVARPLQPAVPSGDGALRPALPPPVIGRPPEWVYEAHSHTLSDEMLVDLYVSLRMLASPIRLEVQEGVLRREILRRMRVAG